MFSITHSGQNSDGYGGRIGVLALKKFQKIETPSLFPVVCFVTGTTPRGGGLWKYILQANQEHGLLRRNGTGVPVLSQVLHFLDFIPGKVSSFNEWKEEGIRNRYNDESSLELDYKAPIFLDSGGFQLMRDKGIDLAAYGLSLENGQGAKTIFDLQISLEGNIVASLDYPLPPGLSENEAKQRVKNSISNAIETAEYLQDLKKNKPFLMVAVHGWDRTSIKRYVSRVFQKMEGAGIDFPFGLAIGSLVPLRGARKYHLIAELIRGVRDGIPDHKKDITPIHTFGVNASMVPLLTYLGVDSFDSSTYVQETTNLNYVDPDTRRPRPILQFDELPCDCSVCESLRGKYGLEKLKKALTTVTSGGRPLEITSDGAIYKSEYYSYIALHNLEMDFQLTKETGQAIKDNRLQDFLLEYSDKFPNQRKAVEAIAINDAQLQAKLSRVLVSVPQQMELFSGKQEVSYSYNSNSYNCFKKKNYKPVKTKDILLILPCSGDKPYSKSHSHRFIKHFLEQALEHGAERIHKVTLSGLYGPVPEEHEQEKAVLSYDFYLNSHDQAQIQLVADRLVKYLEKYQDHYVAYFGYATSKAYRMVLEQVAQEFSDFSLLPSSLQRRTRNEFFRSDNVSELSQEILSVIKDLEESN